MMNIGFFVLFAIAQQEKMTMTITETCVEERLQPQPPAYTPQNKATKHSVPYALMRSASFDRLRQFPTYFCRHGSAEIYQWLFSSKNTVSSAFSQVAKQIQSLLLTICVLGGLGIVAAQLAACLITVATNTLPYGLNFLIACVVIMASLATSVFFPYKTQPQRTTRSLRKRPIKD